MGTKKKWEKQTAAEGLVRHRVKRFTGTAEYFLGCNWALRAFFVLADDFNSLSYSRFWVYSDILI
jgi:hypothetical protein